MAEKKKARRTTKKGAKPTPVPTGKIRVQMACMGDVSVPLELASGTTLKQAIEGKITNLDPKKHELRVNNEEKAGTYVLQADDIITLVPKVVGG